MNISGSIVTVEDFFSAVEKIIKINEIERIKLTKDRKYVVPNYQREIRWKKNNITNLIRDIKNSEIFLGNIILSRNGDTYQIIDGQQRITSLYLIVYYLKKKFPNLILNMYTSICELQINSFSILSSILEKEFNISTITDEEKSKDSLQQLSSYIELWDAIKDIKDLEDINLVNNFFNKLQASKINLVISESTRDSENINYFLDVNVKSVPLDDEDIFKGTFLKKTNSLNTSNLDNWYQIKKKYVGLSCKRVFDKKYTLITLLEQYFRFFFAYNYKELNIQFDSKLLLTEPIESRSITEGTHILYILNILEVETCLSDINKLMDFIFLLYDNENAPQSNFKDILKAKPIYKITKIDDDNCNLIYKSLRFLTLINDNVLKIFTIHYFFTVIQHENPDNKSVEFIFTALYYSILFSILSEKKTGAVYSIFQENNIESKLVSEAQLLLRNNKIDTSKIIRKKAFFDIIESDNFLTKGLAMIFNYFNITKNPDYVLNINNKSLLLSYLNDSTKYSTEHLIINKSIKYKENMIEISYDKGSKSQLNSILNFIFIDDDLNNAGGNLCFDEKITLYNKNISKIDCKFSKSYVKLLFKMMKKYKSKTYQETITDDKFWDNVSSLFNSLIESLKID